LTWVNLKALKISFHRIPAQEENSMKKSGKARHKPRRAKNGPASPAAPLTLQDAGAVSAALFEPKEREAGADADPSVEDPLQDWPEIEAEKDRWLLDRNGGGNEPPDR
jgi:hypothetical protein